MAASSSSDEHIDSEDEQEQPDSDSQGPGQDPSSQGRRAVQTELRSQQAVTTLERTLPSRDRLLDESNQKLQASEGKSGQGKPGVSEESSQRISRQSISHRSRSSKSRRKEVKQYLSKTYRDLLNIDIEDVRYRSSSERQSLVSSQIEGSYWSAHEKHSLFRGIERSGSVDLPTLCQAVQTKSAAEIKAYVILLNVNASGAATDDASSGGLSMSDVPAAYEISSDCESALNAAAEALERHVHEHDVKAEQKVNGDEWLIDTQAADRIELDYEESLQQHDDAEDSVDTTSIIDQAEPPPASTFDLIKPECLLRPAILLELSTCLFMNNGADAEQNWHRLDPLSTDADEPAMFRSALHDLHDLTISLTRRLVQVVIFQAMTRLRAEDSSRTDWTPSVVVRDADVHSALDMLSQPRNAEGYWASCARRCRLDVYSDSKKFADGRPGTKQGRRLSYDEVETELGLDWSLVHAGTNMEELFDEELVGDVLHDDQMFTDASNTDSESHDDAVEIGSARFTRKRPRKRKRALSPHDFCRAETSYLEAADRHASITEEKRLRKLLKFQDTDDADALCSQLPQEPGPVPDALVVNLGWCEEVEYEAEWEQPQGPVAAESYQEMEVAGQVGRRRRRATMAEVQRRLQEGINLPFDEEEDSHGSGDDGDEIDHETASTSSDVALSD
ncbi:hypothetical protein DOTSEDRAFT_51027 [Dothistroma septosporum NZE10]|uniref:Myb-like domain-containing protein n=1 Tax=Dothistroma septosporum (strain NZE10 / CBS 128990) TaxID=675120 RepID=N1PXG6_DOTSN|nr:hypothetical protein DOTSEDRAFT_51027 [Dothistroma septosporum NZE10]